MSIESREKKEKSATDTISLGHLPGGEEVLAAQVLRRLEKAGARGVPLDRLEEDFDPDGLARALDRLRQRGDAVVRGRGRWAAGEFDDQRIGVLETHEDGVALVRPPSPPGSRNRAAPFGFVEANHLGGGRDGDRVRLKELGHQRPIQGRRLPSLRVSEVLLRRNAQLVGTLEIGDDDRRWLVPFDRREKLEVLVEGGDDLLEDQWVVVRLGDGGGGDQPVRGQVVEVLGEGHKPGVEVEVALRHFRIRDEFPGAVTRAAAELPEDPDKTAWRGREDLRDEVLVTIDGESARDFDDAVSLERTDGPAGPGFRLGVHIADVAHWVPEGGRLDREAYRRATSVYFPERAVPMLPEELSNGLCSLKPGVPRLALSVFLDFDADGRVVGQRFAETVIRSHRRLTYDEVRRVLEEPQESDPDEYGPVLPLLRDLRDLMHQLLERRQERGSIDFDLPAGDVILNTDGVVVGVTAQERHVAHRIIEECMIAANEAMAREILERGDEIGGGALFRVHDAPEKDDLEELKGMVRTFGLTLKGSLDDLHPGELQRLLERVQGRPEEELVTTLVLRTMKRAEYSPECRGHYALASREYCHFTSPIRRYPDLVVHRRLKALLAEDSGKQRRRAEETCLTDRLEAMALHTSEAERRAERAERDVLQWKKVRFLEDRVGETFEGRVTGVQPFGLFVMLDEVHVDGLVPIRTLEDDYYAFDEERHKLVGQNHGRVLQLADRVQVRLDAVDLRQRGLDLVIADLQEPKRRRGGPRRRKRRRSS